MQANASPPPTPLANCTALVVDDDSFAVQAMASALQAAGVGKVVSAGDGRAALKLIKTLPVQPDFLVCDLYMPNMDGVEFLEVLAERAYPGGIIIVTGVDPILLEPVKVMAQYKALKVLGAFVKPLAIDDLVRVLRPATP